MCIRDSSESVMSLLQQGQPVQHQQVSPVDIEISVYSHKYTVTYPFPVKYKAKVSRKRKTVTISAFRENCTFDCRKSILVNNVGNEFSLLRRPISDSHMDMLSLMQFTKNDTEMILKYGYEFTKLSSLENLCLLYTSPSPRDATLSRMPSSA